MNPDEIKQKMEEVDAKMRTKLAELGFTPDEIERQLDRSVPEDVKKAEREKVLQRKFAEELNDPNSGLMDAIVARAADEAERRIPELKAEAERERRAKRMKIAIGAGVGLAAVAVAVWFFAIRDARSACEKLVGPIAELEKLTGIELEMRSGYEGKYSCYQYVDREGRAGGFVVNLETNDGSGLDYWKTSEEARKFVGKETLQVATGDAFLFIAGDTPDVSPDDLLKRAEANVGRTSDPMGAALANLPPSQHVALIPGRGKGIKLSLDRTVFSVDKAKAYVQAVAQRAK